MPNHTVKQGEHISSLAKKYGFADFLTIWDHPSNAALKQQRKNPNVLFPGDSVFIPEKQEKEETRPTGKAHRFITRRKKLRLEIVLKDIEGKPLASTQCRLEIDGSDETLTTDGSGKIKKEISPEAQHGKLTVQDLEIPLKIGHLDPVEELSGQRARLNNLGYDAGNDTGPDDEQFRSAAEEFQCDQGLTVNGECDAATQAKLKEVHGC